MPKTLHGPPPVLVKLEMGLKEDAMSFEMRMKFPDVSGRAFPSTVMAIVHEEFERLRMAGWSIDGGVGRTISGMGRIFPAISREIQQLYLAEVHWNQRFRGLEPTEISVVFQNSPFPTHFGDRLLDISDKWVRFESEMFPGFWYEILSNLGDKTLEIQVSGGQQLGKENLKKFLLTLCSYYTVTKIARELHQLRMAASKQNVPEMDRHHHEILETLGNYLPR